MFKKISMIMLLMIMCSSTICLALDNSTIVIGGGDDENSYENITETSSNESVDIEYDNIFDELYNKFILYINKLKMGSTVYGGSDFIFIGSSFAGINKKYSAGTPISLYSSGDTVKFWAWYASFSNSGHYSTCKLYRYDSSNGVWYQIDSLEYRFPSSYTWGYVGWEMYNMQFGQYRIDAYGGNTKTSSKTFTVNKEDIEYVISTSDDISIGDDVKISITEIDGDISTSSTTKRVLYVDGIEQKVTFAYNSNLKSYVTNYKFADEGEHEIEIRTKIPHYYTNMDDGYKIWTDYAYYYTESTVNVDKKDPVISIQELSEKYMYQDVYINPIIEEEGSYQIEKYEVDFGDGTTAEYNVSDFIVHEYDKYGTITVEVTAIDTQGDKYSVSTPLTLKTPVDAFIINNPTYIPDGSEVEFELEILEKDSFNINKINVDFGDGTINDYGLDENITHVYNDVGTYEPIIKCYNDDNLESILYPDEIEVYFIEPIFSASIEKSTYAVGEEMEIITEVNSGSTTIDKITVDYGFDSIEYVPNEAITYIFDEEGTYLIDLTVYYANGEFVSKTAMINVYNIDNTETIDDEIIEQEFATDSLINTDDLDEDSITNNNDDLFVGIIGFLIIVSLLLLKKYRK